MDGSSFTYSKDQIVHLAGWYTANKKFGSGFSNAMRFAVTRASADTPAIWPNATLGIVGHIAEMLEKIQRVDNGDREFWGHSLPKKTDSPNEVNYISYFAENWIREGLGLEEDPTLNLPVKFKPDYILDLREEGNAEPCPPSS